MARRCCSAQVCTSDIVSRVTSSMTKSIQPTTRHKLAVSLSTVSVDVAYMARRIVQSLAIPSCGIDRPSCRERTSRIDIAPRSSFLVRRMKT